MKILIKKATLINEGRKWVADVCINGQIIEKIGVNLPENEEDTIINAEGKFLIPGVIDDQVHFREPGLTHKGDIESESRAAIAGGVTSYIDQPNTVPNTITQELLEQKYSIASQKSYANYSFSIGGTNDNLEEVLKTNPQEVAAVKLFLGSSTGNMLVDNPATLENIFSKVQMPICVHCEDETTIRENTKRCMEEFGEDIPMAFHPKIRSAEACYISSSKAIELAKKTGARLHIYHVSTGIETTLFDNSLPLEQKKITAEVCVHHLHFSEEDYGKKGALIKWNPAVKSKEDRDKLWEALLDDRIDVIATDHAPHTLEEKDKKYAQCPSGAPLVQHSLGVMLHYVQKGKISLEKVVEKMCHNPAVLFNIHRRGFIREGYQADLVLIDMNQSQVVGKDNILYKCGWSPLEGMKLNNTITHTFVNGYLAYENGRVHSQRRGQRLRFDR